MITPDGVRQMVREMPESVRSELLTEYGLTDDDIADYLLDPKAALERFKARLVRKAVKDA